MTMYDDFWVSGDLLRSARARLKRAEARRGTKAIRRAQIRLDLLTLGSDAVTRKIYAGHRYGTAGTTQDISK